MPLILVMCFTMQCQWMRIIILLYYVVTWPWGDRVFFSHNKINHQRSIIGNAYIHDKLYEFWFWRIFFVLYHLISSKYQMVCVPSLCTLAIKVKLGQLVFEI